MYAKTSSPEGRRGRDWEGKGAQYSLSQPQNLHRIPRESKTLRRAQRKQTRTPTSLSPSLSRRVLHPQRSLKKKRTADVPGMYRGRDGVRLGVLGSV